MPFQIPAYVQQVRLPGPVDQTRADANAAGAVGAALSQGGQQIAEHAMRWKAQQDSTLASQAIAEASLGMTRDLFRRQQSAPEGAPNFTAEFEAAQREAINTATSNLPGSVRAIAHSRLVAHLGGLIDNASRFEATSRRDWQTRTVGRVIDTNADVVRLDGGRWDQVWSDTEAAIRGSGLSERDQSVALENARQRMRSEQFMGLADRDPARAQEMLNSGDFAGAFGPHGDRVFNYVRERMNAVSAENRRIQTEAETQARASVIRDVREDIATYTASGRGSGQNGEPRVTEQRVRQAFRNDPDRADQIIEELNAARDGYAIRQRVMSATPDERNALLEQMRAGVSEAEPQRRAQDANARTFRLSEQDVEDLTRIALAEAGGQGRSGLAGVVFTILNRQADGAFGGSIREIINRRNQFTPATRAGGVENLPRGSNPDRDAVRAIIRDIASGALTDPTNGARFFLNRAIAENDFGQGNDANMTVQIGGHTFYRALRDGVDRGVPTYSVALGDGEAGPSHGDDGTARGAAARARQLALTERAIADFNRELDRDPGGVAVQMPAIREAFQAAAQNPNDPNALGIAMQMSVEYQRAVGVPEYRLAPLAAGAVQDIARRFAAAGTSRERLEILEGVTNIGDPAIRNRVIAQLESQGPDANRIPRDIALVLDIASDPNRRSQAEAILGAMTVPRREQTAMQPADQQAIQSQIATTYDTSGGTLGAPGIGTILRRQAAVTREANYSDLAERYRDTLIQVARVRGAPGSFGGTVDAAYADLFGHYRTLSSDNLAHVYVPRGTDLDVLRAGLESLRQAERPNFDAAMQPSIEAGRLSRDQHQAIVRDFGVAATWVNEGQLYALVDPYTGRAVARYALSEIVSAGAAVIAQRPSELPQVP